jgi:hypothetical protein
LVLALLIGAGSRGPLPRNIGLSSIRAKGVDSINRPSPMKITLQHPVLPFLLKSWMLRAFWLKILKHQAFSSGRRFTLYSLYSALQRSYKVHSASLEERSSSPYSMLTLLAATIMSAAIAMAAGTTSRTCEAVADLQGGPGGPWPTQRF